MNKVVTIDIEEMNKARKEFHAEEMQLAWEYPIEGLRLEARLIPLDEEEDS